MAKIITDINIAEKALKENLLVAIPTETVYGLAGNGLSESSIKAIYKAKNRPHYNPLILHIGDLSQLEKLAVDIPEIAMKLAYEFWPGPLTLVLPKSALVPDIVSSGLSTVGIRMPSHPMTRTLLKNLPFPLAAPSANPFGYISPTTADHVQNQLKDDIPFILDGGPCPKGLESTIVGFDHGNPIIYRHGFITQEQLTAFLGRKISNHVNSLSQPLSPGMLPFHYAPKTPLTIIDSVVDITNGEEGKIGLIGLSKSFIPLQWEGKKYILSHEGLLEEAAQNLYKALRYLDQLDLEHIYIEKIPNQGIGMAINDRLSRAVKRRFQD